MLHRPSRHPCVLPIGHTRGYPIWAMRFTSQKKETLRDNCVNEAFLGSFTNRIIDEICRICACSECGSRDAFSLRNQPARAIPNPASVVSITARSRRADQVKAAGGVLICRSSWKGGDGELSPHSASKSVARHTPDSGDKIATETVPRPDYRVSPSCIRDHPEIVSSQS